MDQRLVTELQRVARRYRQLFGWRAIAVAGCPPRWPVPCCWPWGGESGWTSPWTTPVLVLAAMASVCWPFGWGPAGRGT